MTDIGERFIAALAEVEHNSNTEAMLGLFGENAKLYNPALLEGLHGRQGAQRFWEEYAKFFVSVSTRFTRQLECEGVVVLEWVAEGLLKEGGKPLAYGGVTMLTHDGAHIQKFNAYYDTSQIVPLRASQSPSGIEIERKA